MTDLPYSFEPVPGYNNYRVTTLLRDYLSLLMEDPGNKEHIDQVLNLISGYTDQLRNLRMIDRSETTQQVFQAIDGFFANTPEENKKGIQCSAGCTHCCFIDIEIAGDEAASIIDYCRENGMEIDRDYLARQAEVGRKTYSDLSRCVFLKEGLCSIYPVRPVACRKHWVKTDPALCDFSENTVNRVGAFFNINTEILASAMLNVDETGPLEKILLKQLEKTNPPEK